MGGVSGRVTIDCSFSNEVVSGMCSFDGGPLENCSFPLELGIDRFGTDNHTVEVTVVDVFGQSLTFSRNFVVPGCKLCTDCAQMSLQLVIM